MQPADRLVLAAYLVALFAFGVASAGLAGRSGDGFALGGRRLRWWTLGVADAASRGGHDAAWVAAVVAAGFLGLQLEYWIGAAVALPVGIVWARYRRRLGLTSGPELLEARYGRRAAPLRTAAAIVGGLGVGAFGIGLLLRLAVAVGRTATGWSADAILAVVLGGALLTALPGGLAGVARAAVFQGLASFAGRIVLAVIAVGAVGGLGRLLQEAVERRAAGFFAPLPGGEAVPEAFTGPAVVALAAVAFLSAGRMNGAFVQRDLAARTDEDAAAARTLQAVLALGLRVVPGIVLALAAMTLMPNEGGTDLGPELARSYARQGARGWVVVGLLATFGAAVAEGLVAVSASLWNDVHRRVFEPEAEPGKQVLVLRIGVLITAAVALLWARAPAEVFEPASLVPAVAALGVATVPAAALRWLWWRFNLTGEVAAWVAALPLTWVVWGPLALGDRPVLATAVLLAGGGFVAAAACLFAKAHPRSVLLAFHGAARPVGLWGPVVAMQPKREGAAAVLDARLDGASIAAGILVAVAATVSAGAVVEGSWSLLATLIPVAFLGAGVHGALTRRRRWLQGRTAAPLPEVDVEEREEAAPAPAPVRPAGIPAATVPTGPVAPWPKHPEPFANTWGPGASEAALYASTWHLLAGAEEPEYVSVDDRTATHRAGVRWRRSVGLDGVVVRFLEGHVPRQARIGVRREGAESIEWATPPEPAPGKEWKIALPGPAVAVVVEQAAGGGSMQRPGILGIGALTPILSRRPSLELLLERPEGLHRPALPVTVDGCPRTALDVRGSVGLVLECNPPRKIGAIGLEVLRVGAAGGEGLLGAWLASIAAVEIDGTPVKVTRRGLDATMAGVVAGATRVVLRLDRPSIGRRARLPMPDPFGVPFAVRRVTLDPRPVAYPRRPDRIAGLPPDRVRPTLTVGVPGLDDRVEVAPDGTLRWDVPGRRGRRRLLGMNLDHHRLTFRERGRDARAGILVDRAEAGDLRILRSILPAPHPEAGIELRLVIENLADAPRTSLLRLGCAEVEGMRRSGGEDVLLVPLALAGRGIVRVVAWVPRGDGSIRLGGRSTSDPEVDLVERSAEILAGTVGFRLPEAWDDVVRRLVVTTGTRVADERAPPRLADHGPSLAYGRWAEGLALWGAGALALDAFQATFGGARRTTHRVGPGVVRAQGWTAESLLRWAGLGPEHAARIAGRVGSVPRGPDAGPGENHDPAMSALWTGDRATFLTHLAALEAVLDHEVMVHLPAGHAREWTPADDRLPSESEDPRAALQCAGVHLALIRHALVTEPPDGRGARGGRLRLFAGLPADLWGEPLRLVDIPTLAGRLSVAVDPAADGRVDVRIKAPEGVRLELVPPVGEPVALRGGDHRILVG